MNSEETYAQKLQRLKKRAEEKSRECEENCIFRRGSSNFTRNCTSFTDLTLCVALEEPIEVESRTYRVENLRDIKLNNIKVYENGRCLFPSLKTYRGQPRNSTDRLQR